MSFAEFAGSSEGTACANGEGSYRGNEDGFVVVGEASGAEGIDGIADEVEVVALFIADLSNDKSSEGVWLEKIAGLADDLAVGRDELFVGEGAEIEGIVAVDLEVSVWGAGEDEVSLVGSGIEGLINES